ncbi:cuticle protein 76-like [Belonocnema kinseyi]|uniref:cuticle protein 76-like n=1 Tax=Belonocnema kinseyi TaxID=2817044 RepID=UPI00143DA6DB|nr:cuticle protein 76-like [Belonocnema kinseyi]
MFTKIAIVACFLATAKAGFIEQPQAYYQPTALTSTQDNILRSPGNLAQISTQSKFIQTPFSSSSKYQTQVSNPSVVAHTAPVYAQTYAAAPIVKSLQPAVYAAPQFAQTYAAAPVAHAAPIAQVGLLGVKYSPAVAVSHMTYQSPFGVYSY